MNHLYEISTGTLISSTVLSIEAIPDGMAVKVSNLRGVWNTGTLDFDPIVNRKIISKLEFLELFTDVELEEIIDAAKTSTNVGKKVGVFIKKLEIAGFVDLRDARIIAAVNGMESLGLIALGRADEVLV